MEHTYDIKFIHSLNPIYKKKVKTNTDSVYTVVSIDLPSSVYNNGKDDPSSIDDDPPAPDVHYLPEKLFRSVILNEDETNLLSFSLPKSVPFYHFKERYSEIGVPFNLEPSRFLINEIVEGTMINLWWDDSNEHWQISTKKAVSGNYTYFKTPLIEKQKSFKELFTEIVGDFESPEFGEYANLYKSYFYSFVIKHPENHIVHSVFRPTIYLVAVYEKIDDWKVKYIPQAEFMKWNIFPNINVRYPDILKFQTNTAIPTIVSYNHIFSYIECDNEKKMKAILKRIPPHMENENETYVNPMNYMVGVMITDTKTGIRTKIENSVYKYLKELRGNHPSYKYKYYELALSNRLTEFLYYFPQYNELFMQFEEEFHTFAKNIYWYYVNKFILKTPTVVSKKDIPYKINHHINYLHYNIYLPHLKMGEKKKITLNLIYSYIWGMPIKTILYWLNYDSIMAKKLLRESLREPTSQQSSEPVDEPVDEPNDELSDDLIEL